MADSLSFRFPVASPMGWSLFDDVIGNLQNIVAGVMFNICHRHSSRCLSLETPTQEQEKNKGAKTGVCVCVSGVRWVERQKRFRTPNWKR